MILGEDARYVCQTCRWPVFLTETPNVWVHYSPVTASLCPDWNRVQAAPAPPGLREADPPARGWPDTLSEKKRVRISAEHGLSQSYASAPPPWQRSQIGSVYALDAAGNRVDVEHIFDAVHGVIVAMNDTWGIIPDSITILWCPCHADHPVVRAAREDGRFLREEGSTSQER